MTSLECARKQGFANKSYAPDRYAEDVEENTGEEEDIEDLNGTICLTTETNDTETETNGEEIKGNGSSVEDPEKVGEPRTLVSHLE